MRGPIVFLTVCLGPLIDGILVEASEVLAESGKKASGGFCGGVALSFCNGRAHTRFLESWMASLFQ